MSNLDNLDEILMGDTLGVHNKDELKAELRAYISANYRSVKDIEKALGEDELEEPLKHLDSAVSRNDLRTSIRKALRIGS